MSGKSISPFAVEPQLVLLQLQHVSRSHVLVTSSPSSSGSHNHTKVSYFPNRWAISILSIRASPSSTLPLLSSRYS
ncbi:unnamed protein product [Rhodiola kirilowii]